MTAFTLDAADGSNRLTVDGVDVSEHVERVIVDVDGKGFPQVTVFTRKAGLVTGDGVVTVVSAPEPADVLAAAAAWLESIDPAQLGPVVQSRFVSLSDDMVSLTLAVLIDLAREASDG